MNFREKLCAWMFEVTKKPYACLFKRNRIPWDLTSKDLLTFNEGSLGKEVGLFLQSNNIEFIDKLESHDVYHVITGMGTEVKDEVGMQFLLLGNGKRSFYLFSTIAICIFILPEHFKHFMRCKKKGRTYAPIHKLDLQSELFNQISLIRWKLRKDQKPKQLKIFGLLNDHKLS